MLRSSDSRTSGAAASQSAWLNMPVDGNSAAISSSTFARPRYWSLFSSRRRETSAPIVESASVVVPRLRSNIAVAMAAAVSGGLPPRTAAWNCRIQW